MGSVAYTFKTDALGSTPMLVSLTESGIVAVQSGTATIIPLDDVASVRLWFDPTRFDRQRYRCRITSSKGKNISLCSSSVEGLGQFKPQLVEYRAIVEALHRALVRRGAAVSYTAGKSRLSYALNVGSVAVAFAAVGAIVLSVGFDGLGPVTLVKLLVIALCMPALLKWIRRNRPRSYPPLAIPADVLPDVVVPPWEIRAAETPPAETKPAISADDNEGPDWHVGRERAG